MATVTPRDSAAAAAEKLKLNSTARHLFICTGKPEGKGGCCNAELGEASWKRLKEATANGALDSPAGSVQRTAVKCLRVCAAGPIAVVYPDGVWYRECSGDNLEKIIEQHLRNGEPVEELRLVADAKYS